MGVERKVARGKWKRVYKTLKKDDSKRVGIRINDINKQLHTQTRLTKENRDVELISSLLEEVVGLRKEQRFLDDFPSFSSFYQNIKLGEMRLEDFNGMY